MAEDEQYMTYYVYVSRVDCERISGWEPWNLHKTTPKTIVLCEIM
jgi:hypothetical protein